MNWRGWPGTVSIAYLGVLTKLNSPHSQNITKIGEFKVEVDQRLWAKHTECYNKPSNPVTGPDISITTGPGASKDAWSARFLPSISAPVRGRGAARATIRLIRRDVKDVKGTRFVECRRRRKDCRVERRVQRCHGGELSDILT
ncbi:hypothetical protein B0H17DRAFT_1142387 [Mycena rosella]|uniref:Uncharacterized protein n=1 Tax=Mycena rosella TaxID=1033263 RepID=A0AAD7G803_MYCRO|nr:hypothetical protein B0H17DRAFT_1142387 [Mycena rosella]